MNVNVQLANHRSWSGNGNSDGDTSLSAIAQTQTGGYPFSLRHQQPNRPAISRPPPLLVNPTDYRSTAPTSNSSTPLLSSSSSFAGIPTPLTSSTVSLCLPLSLESTLNSPAHGHSHNNAPTSGPFFPQLRGNEESSGQYSRQTQMQTQTQPTLQLQPLQIEGDAFPNQSRTAAWKSRRNSIGSGMSGSGVASTNSDKSLQQIVVSVNQCMNLNMNMTSSSASNNSSYPSSSPVSSPLSPTLFFYPYSNSNSNPNANAAKVNTPSVMQQNYSACYDHPNRRASSSSSSSSSMSATFPYFPSLSISPSSSPSSLERARSSFQTPCGTPSAASFEWQQEQRTWICPLRCGQSFVNAAVDVLRAHLANCPMNGIESMHNQFSSASNITRKRDREDDMCIQSPFSLRVRRSSSSSSHQRSLSGSASGSGSCYSSSSSSSSPSPNAAAAAPSTSFSNNTNDSFRHQSASAPLPRQRTRGMPAEHFWQHTTIPNVAGSGISGGGAYSGPMNGTMFSGLARATSHPSERSQRMSVSVTPTAGNVNAAAAAAATNPGTSGPTFFPMHLSSMALPPHLLGLRAKKARRAGSQLKEKERWYCPMSCGAFYKNTSTKSIRKHLNGGCPVVFNSDSLDVEQLRMRLKSNETSQSLSTSQSLQSQCQSQSQSKSEKRPAHNVSSSSLSSSSTCADLDEPSMPLRRVRVRRENELGKDKDKQQ